MSNFYARAIQIIASEGVDYRTIAIEIAKRHPKTFVECSNFLKPIGKTWQEKCKEMMLNSKKIEAIKLCRTETGMGLMEAKHFVESL